MSFAEDMFFLKSDIKNLKLALGKQQHLREIWQRQPKNNNIILGLENAD